MRVAIVGGGPGGLFTAYLLQRKSSVPLDIRLFEASGRLGGKLVTARFGAAPIPYEAGAAELYGYFHIGPDPLYNLIRSFGIRIRNLSGRTVVLDDQVLNDLDDVKRKLGEKTWSAICDFHNRGRKSISPQAYYDAGWPDDNEHPLSRRSFRSILAKVPDINARRYLEVAVHSDLATEPHKTSALFGVENALMEHEDYVRLYALEGGMETLTQELAARISGKIELNSEVTRVEKTKRGAYRVFFREQGAIASAEFDTVVLALPNCSLPRIEWGGSRLEKTMCKHHLYYEGMAHYLRVTCLFKKPFWRDAVTSSYFQSDAFGGCCVYDESSKLDTQHYGVLSWLLAGTEALLRSNFDDQELIRQALASLPSSIAEGRELFIEGKVHRWVGAVSAPPLGHRVRGSKLRHLPDPKNHPKLFVVGDYLFDTTLNGVLDSADIASNLVLRSLAVRRREFSLEAAPIAQPENQNSALKKSYFDYYNGRRSYEDTFKEYFDHKHLVSLIRLIWKRKPPYRLLDSGSANGLSLDAFRKAGVDAWGVENNLYIHRKTPSRLKAKNILGDVRDLPFEDNFFDFVYDTCLCYVPECDLDRAISELHRVTKYGVLYGSPTSDCDKAYAKKSELFYGVKSLKTLSEWSERFVNNGFRLAISDQKILNKVWKLENWEGDAALWYSKKETFRYAFYSKELDLSNHGSARVVDDDAQMLPTRVIAASG